MRKGRSAWVRRMLWLLWLLWLPMVCSCGKAVTVTEIDIIPEPVFEVKKEGTYTLNRNIAIATSGLGQNSPTAKYIMNSLRHARMRPSLVSLSEESDIELIVNDTANPELGEEGYLLEIRPNGISLSANTEQGLFYAFQSLVQIIPPDVEEHRYRSIVLPACTILDYPRFAWRGAHLDMTRNPFPVKFIKRYLDLMARYKLNYFHWVLPDSSALAGDSIADTTDIYYYSDAEKADVADYAMSLGITVVPGSGTDILWDDEGEALSPLTTEEGCYVAARTSLQAGIKAARAGKRVVMCPEEFCRLDSYQADPRYQPCGSGATTTLAKAYLFDPAPQGTNKYVEPNIVGGQCLLRTDSIPSQAHAEYLLLPRLLSTSECLWSPRQNKDWNRFRKKVELQKANLGARGYSYCEGSFTPLFHATLIDKQTANIAISTEVPNTYIFYTTDGSTPTRNSQIYVGPVNLTRGTHLKILPVYKNLERDSVYEYIIK